MTARSNPLALKQPTHDLAAVEEALRQGLGGQLPFCAISVEPHKAGPPGREATYELIRVKAYGKEWTFDSAMSSPAAYSTGVAVAKMVAEAGEQAKTKGKTG